MKRIGTNEFDYCKWAKVLVAIPAMPLIAILAAAPFSNPVTQSIAAVISVFVAISIAIWLDHLPPLQATFCPSKKSTPEN